MSAFPEAQYVIDELTDVIESQGSGGSLITVRTEDSEFYGETITLSDGHTSMTATMSNQGVAQFSGVTMSGELTVSATVSGQTYSTTVNVTYYGSYNVELAMATGIYGVIWDGSSSQAWTRTDDAVDFTDPTPAINNGIGSSPFDSIAPWSEMEKVNDATCGTMVKIPKFYFKWTQSGSSLKLQISKEAKEGFQVCPACADRDGHGERDYVLVGRYHCATSTFKSTTGVKPAASATRDSFRTSIHNLGSNVWQYDIWTHITIWMLYLVEYANWDTQKTIGYGCGNNSGTENMGYTDGMTYHTGTSQTDRTTYGVGTQYRYIEGLWDNVLDWCDGIYFSDKDIYVIKNPANNSDTTGGVKVGTRADAGGYIKSMKQSAVSGYEWFLYPDDCQGADQDSYVGDYCYYSASGVVLRVGGYYGQYRNRGLFCLYGYSAASGQDAGIGSRLLKIPSAS